METAQQQSRYREKVCRLVMLLISCLFFPFPRTVFLVHAIPLSYIVLCHHTQVCGVVEQLLDVTLSIDPKDKHHGFSENKVRHSMSPFCLCVFLLTHTLPSGFQGSVDPHA